MRFALAAFALLFLVVLIEDSNCQTTTPTTASTTTTTAPSCIALDGQCTPRRRRSACNESKDGGSERCRRQRCCEGLRCQRVEGTRRNGTCVARSKSVILTNLE